MRNTPPRAKRLRAARVWIKTYSGGNAVKGYSKKFGVDKLCAIKELRMIGVEVSEKYEKQILASMEADRLQKLSRKKTPENDLNPESALDHLFRP